MTHRIMPSRRRAENEEQCLLMTIGEAHVKLMMHCESIRKAETRLLMMLQKIEDRAADIKARDEKPVGMVYQQMMVVIASIMICLLLK